MNTVIEPSLDYSDDEDDSFDSVITTIRTEFTHIIETCDALLLQLSAIRNRVTEAELYIDDLPAPDWISKQYTEFQARAVQGTVTWGQFLLDTLQGLRT